MRMFLGVFLSLVFSSVCLASEPIEYNGKKGVFFTTEEAKKILDKIEVELPSLKHQIALLEKKLQLEIDIESRLDEEIKAEEEISEKWKKNYESSMKEVDTLRRKENVKFYIYAGLFMGGSVLGAGIMYGSSLLLKNLR